MINKIKILTIMKRYKRLTLPSNFRVIFYRGKHKRLRMLSVNTQVFVVSAFVFRVTHYCRYEFCSFLLQRNDFLLDYAVFLHKWNGFPGQFENDTALSILVNNGRVWVRWRCALHRRGHLLLLPLPASHFTHSGEAPNCGQKVRLWAPILLNNRNL